LIYRNYSDATPDVSFFYDGMGLASVPANSIGKTTKIASNASETPYTSFDNLGRIKSSEQITSGQTYSFADYSYNLAGNLISQTYPLGRVVNYEYDANNDLQMVTSQKNSNLPAKTYASDFAYTAAGAVEKMQLGNGLWETAVFNNRLQITETGLGTTENETSLLKLELSYGTASQNNGSVREQKISYPGLAQPIVQSYTYDSLNRLERQPRLILQTDNHCLAGNKLSQDGMKLFGLLEMDLEYKGVRFAIGIRNSNDKSTSIRDKPSKATAYSPLRRSHCKMWAWAAIESSCRRQLGGIFYILPQLMLWAAKRGIYRRFHPL
jgi:YD repeat-containing protein